MTPVVAIVDDEPRMGQILSMVLDTEGHRTRVFGDPVAFVDALADLRPDLVLLDLKMPRLDGVQVLARIQDHDPTVPVILLTAHATVATAVAAMQGGAHDYLEKPIDNDRVRRAVARALDHGRLARENRHLRAQVRSQHDPDALIAVSGAMADVVALARRAARSQASVLIGGESGTGKERIARMIHAHSDRVGGPFVPVNCKAFATSVLESELFGHARGAFTGAARDRAGVFERASGGTVFLDEIGEVGDDFQAKLLRVLQEGEVLPVGADRPRRIDVRVVSATHRPLDPPEVRARALRDDLYFRLAVIPIRIPPLRERRGDILPLAHHFLVRACEAEDRPVVGFSPEVMRWLVHHDWPGNVRELQNAVERGVVLARSDHIEEADLLLAPTPPRGDGQTLAAAVDQATRLAIREALAASGGVRIDAAARLGIERTTLYRLMRRLDIEAPT